jgi:hypothetical protein
VCLPAAEGGNRSLEEIFVGTEPTLVAVEPVARRLRPAPGRTDFLIGELGESRRFESALQIRVRRPRQAEHVE